MSSTEIDIQCEQMIIITIAGLQKYWLKLSVDIFLASTRCLYQGEGCADYLILLVCVLSIQLPQQNQLFLYTFLSILQGCVFNIVVFDNSDVNHCKSDFIFLIINEYLYDLNKQKKKTFCRCLPFTFNQISTCWKDRRILVRLNNYSVCVMCFILQ